MNSYQLTKKALSCSAPYWSWGYAQKSSLLFLLSAPGAASLGMPILHRACLAPHPGQGFPASLLPAWAASEHSDAVTRDFLSHHDVGWTLPVSCKEGFTLKLLLAYVLLSKCVVGPCFVAVLLCWISSFLAWCVGEWWLTVDIKTRFSCVQHSLFRGEWAPMWKQDQFSVFYPVLVWFGGGGGGGVVLSSERRNSYVYKKSLHSGD